MMLVQDVSKRDAIAYTTVNRGHEEPAHNTEAALAIAKELPAWDLEPPHELLDRRRRTEK